jgi:glucose uptake protein
MALIPMFAWGSIGLVGSKIGGDPNQQTLGMTFGAFLFSLVLFVVERPHMDWKIVLVGLISGIFWSVGQNGQFQGMRNMGVSVAVPISTGMQLFVNTIAGAVFFHEWRRTNQFIFGFIALILLVLGAYLTGFRDNSEQTKASNSSLNFAKGFRALLLSTVGYAVYTIVINASKVETLSVILPLSVGMIIGATLFSIGKVKIEPVVFKNMITGVLWGIGNFFMLLAMEKIGLALAFSFSQMGIIISTLGGIFLLGETKTKKEFRYALLGSLFVILGGVLLGYVKSIG